MTGRYSIPRKLRFLASEFFWGSVLKVTVGVFSILLFPFITLLLGSEVASAFALLLSQTMVYSVLGRLGADQYLSQMIVNEGGLQGRARNFLLLLAALNVLVFSFLVLSGFASLEILVLALSISLSTIVGRIQIGLGSGLAGLVTTSLVPLVAYYVSIGLSASGQTGTEMLPYSAAIVISAFSSVLLLKVTRQMAEPTPTQIEIKNLPYFSGVTIIRSMRNESPVLLASFLGFSDIWLLASAQRALNFFTMLQVVINSVFFRHAFIESGARRFKEWLWVYVIWLVAIVAISGAVAIRAPETFANVTFLDGILFALAGFFSAGMLKYGNIGIRLIHQGRIRAFTLILLIFYLAAVLLIMMLKPFSDTLGQIWIAAIFSASQFLSYLFLDKICDYQD